MAVSRENEKWNREEHILAFNLYCKIPFGQIDQDKPHVIELSRLLGRPIVTDRRKVAPEGPDGGLPSSLSSAAASSFFASKPAMRATIWQRIGSMRPLVGTLGKPPLGFFGAFDF